MLTLGLGIAANTTVFTIVNGALLRELPFEGADRIVSLGVRNLGNAQSQGSGLSYADFQDWAPTTYVRGYRRGGRGWGRRVRQRSAAVRVRGAYVSWNTFALIRQRPALGREFLEADDRPGAAPVVILGEAVWRTGYPPTRGYWGAQSVLTVYRRPSSASCRKALAFLFERKSGTADRAPGKARTSGVTACWRRASPATGRELRASGGGAGPHDRPCRTVSCQQSEHGTTPRAAQNRNRSTDSGSRGRAPRRGGLRVAHRLRQHSESPAGTGRKARAMSRSASHSAQAVGVSSVNCWSRVSCCDGCGCARPGLSSGGIQIFWSLAAESAPPYWLRFPIDRAVFAYFAVICLSSSVLCGLVPAWQASRSAIVATLNDMGRTNSGGRSARRWTGAFVAPSGPRPGPAHRGNVDDPEPPQWNAGRHRSGHRPSGANGDQPVDSYLRHARATPAIL